MKEKLSAVFTGMQGRYTRLRIIMVLCQEPLNTHQITKELKMDYKSIQRNIKVLENNNLIEKIGDNYGAVYFVTDYLMSNLSVLDEVIQKVDKKLSSKKIYID